MNSLLNWLSFGSAASAKMNVSDQACELQAQ